MIKPTIGRVVLFHPHNSTLGSAHHPAYDAEAKSPLPALVCYVHGERMINIGGFDMNGSPFKATSVPLLQDDDPTLENGYYAEWMPYQKQVAAKAMVMNNQAIEQEIQAKGLTAPRVTPDDIEANIDGEFSFTVGNAAMALNCPMSEALDLLTICVLKLKNGYTVTGESACASPENFDAELGHKIARQNAVDKVWPLMGYALKERLSA